jgi:nitrogen fixation-related uncharacterized protein
MSFVDVWIVYAIFGTTAFSTVFVWAVRSRQFTELDRQRYLALRAEEPVESERTGRTPTRPDLYTLLALALITLGVITAGLWLGLVKT